MHVQTPNSSFFPEIDFVSKCVELKSERTASSVSQLLYPLSNANSGGIRNRIRQTRLFVGVGDEDHVEINLDGRLGRLTAGQMYS
jgi:hypothetical protein